MRESDYAGVSDTPLSLLNFGSKQNTLYQIVMEKHLIIIFAQRESVETVIYL